MEVTNRFKGLDLVHRVPEGPWMEVHNISQEVMTKTIPKKKKCKKVKCLSEEPLQIAEKRREAQDRGERERYTHLNAEFQRAARRVRNPSSVINAKKQRQRIEWERLEITSRILEILREHFMQRWAQ